MKYKVLNKNNLFHKQELTFLVFIFGTFTNTDSGVIKF